MCVCVCVCVCVYRTYLILFYFFTQSPLFHWTFLSCCLHTRNRCKWILHIWLYRLLETYLRQKKTWCTGQNSGLGKLKEHQTLCNQFMATQQMYPIFKFLNLQDLWISFTLPPTTLHGLALNVECMVGMFSPFKTPRSYETCQFAAHRASKL